MTEVIMQAAQAVAEVAAKGKSSIVLDAGLLALLVSQATTWFLILKKPKNQPAKDEEKAAPADKAPSVPSPGNGLGSLLKEHGERLTRHDAEIKGLCDRMTEIRGENISAHDKLFGKIDTLKDQIFDKIDEVRAGK